MPKVRGGANAGGAGGNVDTERRLPSRRKSHKSMVYAACSVRSVGKHPFQASVGCDESEGTLAVFVQRRGGLLCKFGGTLVGTLESRGGNSRIFLTTLTVAAVLCERHTFSFLFLIESA